MRKIEYGFRNVVYAVVSNEDETVVNYATPKSFLAQGVGGISASVAPNGEQVDFYADDISWFNENVNNGYDISLALTKVSDDFKKDVLGWREDVNGALIENADAISKKFALGFEVQGNDTPKRTWYYYCSASRPQEDEATKENTIAPTTRTLDIQAKPRPTDKNVKVSFAKEKDADVFNNFFTAVYEEQQASI